MIPGNVAVRQEASDLVADMGICERIWFVLFHELSKRGTVDLKENTSYHIPRYMMKTQACLAKSHSCGIHLSLSPTMNWR
jgi:hypothetical protein